MQIDLTKKEYRFLLDILSIADWIFMAHKIDKDRRFEMHEKVIQKFYSFAKEMGYEDLIEFAEDADEYFPTKNYEDSGKFLEYIEEFENDSFWDELIERLTTREVLKKIGGASKLAKLSHEKRLDLFSAVEENFVNEFEQHGLDRVKIEIDENE